MNQLPSADSGADSLTIRLDGQLITPQLTFDGQVARTNVVVAAGHHRLSVELISAGSVVRDAVEFDAIDLDRPDECEVLNNAECLLPYPSSRFLESADTVTGVRVNLPRSGMPIQRGSTLSSAPYDDLDGFAPTVQVLMHFPGNVDLERSDAPRLHAATRTTDLRSLDPGSPTMLIDWDSGERILHFAENDAAAADHPERQIVFLRPMTALTPGHRYIVAVRNLFHVNGTGVEAEPQFAALRDRRPTDIEALLQRQGHYEGLFARLDAFGVGRRNLVLAFDFTVRSDQALTSDLIAMRDQAFDWLAEQLTGDTPTFSVTGVESGDCGLPETRYWREVYGTFTVPLFVTSDPLLSPLAPGLLNRTDSGQPIAQGVTNPPFTIAIPCSAVTEGERPLAALLRGHGLLDSGRNAINAPILYDAYPPLELIAGATDWTGNATPDQTFFLSMVNNLNRFPAYVARQHQGMINTLVLARMMKTGAFNSHPAFQFTDGTGVFLADGEMYYGGGSLGGMFGITVAALTPDVEKFYLDEGGFNVLGQFPRSSEWPAIETLLVGSGMSDPIQRALTLDLVSDLEAQVDGGGYATHVLDDPLPGSNPKQVLMTMAWLDQAVPNLITEIAARTLGLPNLEGSLQSNLPQIADRSGPLSSAFVIYDTGSFDPNDPEHARFVPPLANTSAEYDDCDPHGLRIAIPAAVSQLQQFLRPGGDIRNFCSGTCDAVEPSELPNGSRCRTAVHQSGR